MKQNALLFSFNYRTTGCLIWSLILQHFVGIMGEKKLFTNVVQREEKLKIKAENKINRKELSTN